MANCTSVAGIEFCPGSPAVFIEYSVVNVIGTSIIPVPIAGPLAGVGTLLFGLWIGLLVNVGTSVIGAWIGLLCVRYACRPCFVRMLGRYEKRWQALDQALTAQGWQIALLIRIAPVSPMVLTNILLSLTSIQLHTYIWTCAIGIFPANLPYAYAAQAGLALSEGFPPKDPLMLFITILGLFASLAIAWKIGMIAKRLLRRHGVGDDDPATPESPQTAAENGETLPSDAEIGPASEGVPPTSDDGIELTTSCTGSGGVSEKAAGRSSRRGGGKKSTRFQSLEDDQDL